MKRKFNLFWIIPIFSFLVLGCEEKEELSYIRDRSTVTDIDGNEYKTVMVSHPLFDFGEMEWMAENLRVTQFSNGVPITESRNYDEWRENMGSDTPQFAWSNYDKNADGETYGIMYNWYAAADPNGLCPDGWHVPTSDDWEQLFIILGGRGYAGGKLKSKSNLWQPPNTNATDVMEFASLPNGMLGGGIMFEVGIRGWYWSATEGTGTPNSGFAVHTNYDDEIMGYSAQPKADGRCIRCVKDR